MCVHCGEDMSEAVYTDKAFHDGWLFPHGRPGYSGVTSEKIDAAMRRCPFCWPLAPNFPIIPGPAGIPAGAEPE